MLSRTSWRSLLGLLLLTAITIWTAVFIVADDRLHVFVFDVGQGDAILVKKGNWEMLVDGGPNDRILTYLGQTLPPWDRNIELVILSHTHADHVTGLVNVLERYDIDQIWANGTVHTTQIYLDFLQMIRDRQVPFRAVRAGDRLEQNGLAVEIIHPLEDLTAKRLDNANEGSVVARVSWGEWSMLLAGDLEAGQQSQIISEKIRSVVLKVPHQGSRDAALAEFIETVQPKLAVISVGEDNQYGHPHQSTLELYQTLGIELLRTDVDGTVHFTVDDAIWFKTARTGIIDRLD